MRGQAYRWLATVLGTSVCAGLLWHGGGAVFVQRPVADALLRLASARPPPAPERQPDVAVVAIDAHSVRAFGGDWPWPRGRFAELVRRLDAAGARAIAFDVDFSLARDPAQDQTFARAIAESGHVVLSAHREFQQLPGLGELEIASLPEPRLARHAAAVGAAVVEIADDGVIRRAFRSREIASHKLPSLAEAALAVALREPPEVDAQDSFAIDYRRAQPPVPEISLIDVLGDRFDPALVAGRVVLVGATAVEFQDLWTTPLGPNRPGVTIQAWALRTLAAARAGAPALREPGPAATLLGLLLLSALAGTLVRAPWAWRTAALGVLAVSAPAASLALLQTRGLLLDPVLPVAVVGAHYLLGLEAVRRRLGERLAQRERSLSTLFTVGEATTTPAAGNGLDTALALLGDVVGARGVGLLRSSSDGAIDGARLEWRRSGGRAVVDPDAAARVLRERHTRVFEGALPGGGSGLAIYTPLFAGDAPAGVLVVERDEPTPLDDNQLRTIGTVGAQLALSIENLRLFQRLQATFRSSIAALASAVEARDGYTDQHCRRLAVFSVIMAERLGLDEEEIEAIELGALLHDVGKIGIPDSVLLKEARLSQEERQKIEEHPLIGHRIVEPINGVTETTIGCVRHHHERWNGEGYPDGLAGEEIPLGARIVAIVDVWDALSTDRPYKKAYPQMAVRELLKKDSGVRFEPALVELFLEVLDERGEELLDLIASTTAGMA